MIEVAELRRWGDTFWFISEDGETFYEINRRPTSEEDVAHLRPLGGPKQGSDGQMYSRIGATRRYLHLSAQAPEAEGVEFFTL